MCLTRVARQSSATFLFVLDELRKKRPTEATAPWVVGMGYVLPPTTLTTATAHIVTVSLIHPPCDHSFGPGLALEGVLLRYPEDSAPKGSE